MDIRSFETDGTPVGFDDTGIYEDSETTVAGKIGVAYKPVEEGTLYAAYGVSTLPPGATVLPAGQQQAARAGTLRPGDYTDLNPSWCWAAGAAISTLGDLATYVEAVVGGGLISDELQRQRLDSVGSYSPDYAESAAYGLALARFGPMLGHDGSLPGTTTLLVRAGNGLAWAALFNARSMKPNSLFAAELDPALWQAVGQVSSWPGGDLFH